MHEKRAKQQNDEKEIPHDYFWNGSENFDFKNIEENCNSDEYKYELCYDSNDNSNSYNKIDTNFNKNDNLSFDVEKKEVKLVDIRELKVNNLIYQ